MNERRFVTFFIDDTLWGLDVLQIREVIDGIEATPVPGAASHVRGLMNLRGQIVTVIDVAERLGSNSDNATDRNTCIILKTDAEQNAAADSRQIERVGADPVGLLVSRMGDVIDLRDSEIDNSPANVDEQERRFVKGVFRLESSLLLALRIEPLLEV